MPIILEEVFNQVRYYDYSHAYQRWGVEIQPGRADRLLEAHGDSVEKCGDHRRHAFLQCIVGWDLLVFAR